MMPHLVTTKVVVVGSTRYCLSGRTAGGRRWTGADCVPPFPKTTVTTRLDFYTSVENRILSITKKLVNTDTQKKNNVKKREEFFEQYTITSTGLIPFLVQDTPNGKVGACCVKRLNCPYLVGVSSLLSFGFLWGGDFLWGPHFEKDSF